MADGRLKWTASAEFTEFIAAHKAARQEVARLAKQHGASATDVRAANRAMKAKTTTTRQLSEALVGLSPRASAAASSLSSIGAAAPALAAAAAPIGVIVAAIAALGAVVWSTSSRMSELVDRANLLSEVSGLSVQMTQALSFALDANGSSIDKAQGGLGEFTKRLGEAVMKGGEAEETFAAYHIQIRNLDGSIRDVNMVLRDALQAVEDQGTATERAAARSRLFGNELARAMAAINPDALRAAEERTAGLSDAINDAQRSSAEWDEAMADLSVAMDRLSVELGDEFAGDIATVIGLMATVIEKTSEWSEVLAPLVRTLIPFGNLAHVASQGFWDWAYGVEAATERTKELQRQWKEARAELAQPIPYDNAPTDGFDPLEQWANSDARKQMLDEADKERREAEQKARERRKREEAREAERARKEAVREAERRAKAVSDARAATQLGMNQLLFDIDLEWNEKRQEQIEAGRQLEAEIEAEDIALSQAAMAREAAAAEARRAQREQEMRELEAMRDTRRAALFGAADAIIQFADASGASAEVIAKARLLETIAHQTAAVGRAFAEGGPFLGPALAVTALATIGAQMAALKSAQSQSHMGSQPLQGSGAPDEATIRVRNGQRVTDSHDDRGGQMPHVSVGVVIDNNTHEALQQRGARHAALFPDRRGRAQQTGSR